MAYQEETDRKETKVISVTKGNEVYQEIPYKAFLAFPV